MSTTVNPVTPDHTITLDTVAEQYRQYIEYAKANQEDELYAVRVDDLEEFCQACDARDWDKIKELFGQLSIDKTKAEVRVLIEEYDFELEEIIEGMKTTLEEAKATFWNVYDDDVKRLMEMSWSANEELFSQLREEFAQQSLSNPGQ